MYIIIAILIFEVLILVHELGHFIAARISGVRVLEFAVGMGPKLLQRKGKKTLFTLRAIPFGGFCALEGEDAESEDEMAFGNQNVPKRMFVLVSGAAMNFLLGLALIFAMVSVGQPFYTPTVTSFAQGFPYEGESGLMVGDTFYSIDGHRIYFSSNVSEMLSRGDDRYYDIVLIRDGKKVTLKNFEFSPRDYTENGETKYRYGLNIGVLETGFSANVKYSWNRAKECVRLVWMSLGDLVAGKVGVKDLSGPVGIVKIINDVGTQSETTRLAALNIINLTAFISINLAVMNLLPIPALDGGRVLFMLITWVVEKVAHKKVNPKYEGYIHSVTLILLLGLMVFVMFNDIMRVFNG